MSTERGQPKTDLPAPRVCPPANDSEAVGQGAAPTAEIMASGEFSVVDDVTFRLQNIVHVAVRHREARTLSPRHRTTLEQID